MYKEVYAFFLFFLFFLLFCLFLFFLLFYEVRDIIFYIQDITT